MPHTKQELRAFLAELPGTTGLADIGDEESLLDAGMIDSASMIDLIAHLEKTYSISISDDDMTPENFETIDAIAAYVHRQRESSDD